MLEAIAASLVHIRGRSRTLLINGILIEKATIGLSMFRGQMVACLLQMI